MTKFALKKSHFVPLVAGAASLLVPGSMPVRAQQPPSPPTFRDEQMPETGWLGMSIEEVT